MEQKVSLMLLGYTPILANFKYIRSWKSKLFSILDIREIPYLKIKDVIQDGYLDIKYSPEQLTKLIQCPDNCNFVLAIMPYRFIDNFYMHRINSKCAILSLFGIKEILQKEDISLENFIIQQIYRTCAIRCIFNDISTDDVYNIIHNDTRGCLFDMNGDRSHIIYNTEHPIICDDCKGKIRSRPIDPNIINVLEQELKRIKKPIIIRVIRWIERHPFFSIIISAIAAIILNVVANLLCKVLDM